MKYVVYLKYKYEWIGLVWDVSSPAEAAAVAARKLSVVEYESITEVRVAAVDDMDVCDWK